MISTSDRNSNREGKSQFSLIFVLAYQYRSHSVPLDNAVHRPRWFRGSCTACSRGRDEFQCGEDVFPSNHVRRTIEILQLPFFLANPVFRLILASMVFQITLSVRTLEHLF